MTAPKPRVYRLKSDWPVWKWECECGVESREWGTWLFAQLEANKHSQKHAAERTAGELERWAQHDANASNSSQTEATAAYWNGSYRALRDAAELIRENLVRNP